MGPCGHIIRIIRHFERVTNIGSTTRQGVDLVDLVDLVDPRCFRTRRRRRDGIVINRALFTTFMGAAQRETITQNTK
jgi:hypothetical protein